MKRPIAISLSPNTQGKDVLLALRFIVNPFRFQRGRAIRQSEQWFASFFNAGKAVSFRSGRDSLLAILQAFGIGAGDEVIIQAFTCVAVPNAVLWAGATPAYVDIDESLGIDPTLIRAKITRKTKAIIVQHTFGIPSKIEEIMEIARKKDLLVIEDCAHVVGGEYKGKKLGTFGDASFFSFGRDKAFSSVFGGMALVKEQKALERLLTIQKNAPFPKKSWVAQQLFHPIAFSIILPFYNLLGIGKGILIFFQKIKALSFPVTLADKKSESVPPLIERFPNALAELALCQLSKIHVYNKRRKEFVKT